MWLLVVVHVIEPQKRNMDFSSVRNGKFEFNVYLIEQSGTVTVNVVVLVFYCS